MAKQSIRSIRKGSVRKEVPGGENRKSAQYEYVIEYGEKVE